MNDETVIDTTVNDVNADETNETVDASETVDETTEEVNDEVEDTSEVEEGPSDEVVANMRANGLLVEDED